MTQEEVIARVIRACGQAGLSHMVVGSFASASAQKVQARLMELAEGSEEPSDEM